MSNMLPPILGTLGEYLVKNHLNVLSYLEMNPACHCSVPISQTVVKEKNY